MRTIHVGLTDAADKRTRTRLKKQTVIKEKQRDKGDVNREQAILG
jgi:hypothetical protein